MKLTQTLSARLGHGALLVALVSMPLAAMADHGDDFTHPGFFAGAGGGFNSLNGESYTGGPNRVKDDKLSFRAFGGFRLNPVVSLEAAFVDFGTAQDGDNHVQAHGVIAGGVFEAPLLPQVHPYAKAGVLFWDADSRFSGLNRNDTGTDFTYGAGVRFIMTRNVDIRGEYERFEMEKADVHTISASLQFNF